ncbi:MAG: AAA family ATPase [Magnetococcales bacterium]|nr:AAA family ATPase [Magnetococcales bacterium]
MKISRLKVTDLRAHKQSEFSFQPGMNLLVGVNGVGKTTVLDALRICLSRVLPKFTFSKGLQKYAFVSDDIQVGSKSMIVEMSFIINDSQNTYLFQKQREQLVFTNKGPDEEERINTPDKEVLTPGPSKARKILALFDSLDPYTVKTSPIALFFSTRRSLTSDAKPSKVRASGGPLAAYGNALNSSRELRLNEIASWMHVQNELAKDLPQSNRHLEALRQAATRFLPECKNLRASVDPKPRLLVEKNGKELDVKQLSDGERGMLALVLDLAQRLSQANPKLDDPVRDGQAVVLIDELDLHLHPKWQRQIVEQLTETFPNCQFIATTHSPQIIGEVPHDRIQIMANGQVYSPTHSFGVDSSRVLEEVMDSVQRNEKVGMLLSKISGEIGQNHFGVARKSLSDLLSILGENDPEVTRMRTLLDFMEDEE